MSANSVHRSVAIVTDDYSPIRNVNNDGLSKTNEEREEMGSERKKHKEDRHERHQHKRKKHKHVHKKHRHSGKCHRHHHRHKEERKRKHREKKRERSRSRSRSSLYSIDRKPDKRNRSVSESSNRSWENRVRRDIPRKGVRFEPRPLLVQETRIRGAGMVTHVFENDGYSVISFKQDNKEPLSICARNSSFRSQTGPIRGMPVHFAADYKPKQTPARDLAWLARWVMHRDPNDPPPSPYRDSRSPTPPKLLKGLENVRGAPKPKLDVEAVRARAMRKIFWMSKRRDLHKFNHETAEHFAPGGKYSEEANETVESMSVDE